MQWCENCNFRAEMIQDRAIVTMADSRLILSRTLSIEWRHFQWPWKTRDQDFNVVPLFDAEYISQLPYEIHTCVVTMQCDTNRTYMYTSFTQECHFEWLWMTLSDLAKCSVTRRSRARPHCDSWASCILRSSCAVTNSHMASYRMLCTPGSYYH